MAYWRREPQPIRLVCLASVETSAGNEWRCDEALKTSAFPDRPALF